MLRKLIVGASMDIPNGICEGYTMKYLFIILLLAGCAHKPELDCGWYPVQKQDGSRGTELVPYCNEKK